MSHTPLPHIIYTLQAWTAQQPIGRALSPAEASAEICAYMTDRARKGLGRSVIAGLLVEHAGWQRSGRLLFLPPGVRKSVPKPLPEMVI